MRRKLSRDLDQQLGLGPRDQSAPIAGKAQVAKALAPEDVGHGLTPQPTAHHRGEYSAGRGLDRKLGISREPRPVEPAGIAKHQLSVEPRALDARGRQSLSGRREDVA